MNKQLEKLENELRNITKQIHALKQKSKETIAEEFHHQITLGIKSLIAFTDDIESKIFEGSL